MTIVQAATQADGKYCATSNSSKFAHIWVLVIGHGFTLIAVMALLQYYGRLKTMPEFSAHSPLLKLVSS
jgi:Organic solute transporter Ostalpha